MSVKIKLGQVLNAYNVVTKFKENRFTFFQLLHVDIYIGHIVHKQSIDDMSQIYDKNINKYIIYKLKIIVKGNLKGVPSKWKNLMDESMGKIRNGKYDFLP